MNVCTSMHTVLSYNYSLSTHVIFRKGLGGHRIQLSFDKLRDHSVPNGSMAGKGQEARESLRVNM